MNFSSLSLISAISVPFVRPLMVCVDLMGATGPPREDGPGSAVDDMQGDDMSHDLRHRVRDENIALFGGGDAELTALRVAIHLEDVLGTTLPEHLLDAAHLGSPEAVEATLDELLGPA